jgi:NitT/TauT family transport system substrate-binding protein
VTVNLRDGAFIVVRNDLLSERPDVVKAWLRAELDAQRFLADPRNRQTVVHTIEEQTSGLSEAAIDRALFSAYPADQGGQRERLYMPFDLTPEAIDLLNHTAAVLSKAGRASISQVPAEAVRPELARQVLHELRTPFAPARIVADGKGL